MTRPFQEFSESEAAGGVLLLAASALALAWANSPWAESYSTLWEHKFTIGFEGFALSKSILHWINDGLMAIFFFVVGLEIKRELLVGELASPRQAALPIAGALGGVVVPALLYLSLNAGGTGRSRLGHPDSYGHRFCHGRDGVAWQPCARRIEGFPYRPGHRGRHRRGAGHRNFLHGKSIVAEPRSGQRILRRAPRREHPRDAASAPVCVARSLHVGSDASLRGSCHDRRRPRWHWRCRRSRGSTWKSSSRADVALLDQMEYPDDGEEHILRSEARQVAVMALEDACEKVETPLQRFEHTLLPWVRLIIMPVFALANAGVALGTSTAAAATSPISLGIVLGLVVGKPIGIFCASWLAVRLGLASLPAQVGWRQILGVGALGGIGFTMSIFIAGLAFAEQPLLEVAKLGIFAGSLIAGGTGFLLLFKFGRA